MLLPVRRRRVQLCPSLPVCPYAAALSCSRHPMAPPEGLAGRPCSPSPTCATHSPMPSSRPGSASEPPPSTTTSPRPPGSWPPSPKPYGPRRRRRICSSTGPFCRSTGSPPTGPSARAHTKHGMNMQVIADPGGRLLRLHQPWPGPCMMSGPRGSTASSTLSPRSASTAGRTRATRPQAAPSVIRTAADGTNCPPANSRQPVPHGNPRPVEQAVAHPQILATPPQAPPSDNPDHEPLQAVCTLHLASSV